MTDETNNTTVPAGTSTEVPTTPVATPVAPVTTPPVTPTVPVTPPVTSTITPPVAEPVTNVITKTSKFIIQFPENVTVEKQAEYMQKVEEALKNNDRVVIDPKVKIFVQEQKEEVAPNLTPQTTTAVPVPTVQPTVQINRVSTAPTATTQEDVKKIQGEFAALFLEE